MIPWKYIYPWAVPNPCWMSLTFIIDWTFVAKNLHFFDFTLCSTKTLRGGEVVKKGLKIKNLRVILEEFLPLYKKTLPEQEGYWPHLRKL